MKNPLSFSGYKRFITCPKYYQFHDIEKDRPGKKTSALLFGTIMDEVINNILLGKTETPHDDINLLIDNVLHEDIDFYDHDFDKDLVDMEFYEESARKMGWKGDDLSTAVKAFIKNQDTISEKQKTLVRSMCWDSLQVKAGCMVDGFMQWIYPKIDKVHDVQKHITIDDKIHGYLDFTCTLKDGRKVLFDVKTSRNAYAEDAVSKSPQLALYAHAENYDYAGYIVLVKTLNKQKKKVCPKCGHSVLGGNTTKCNATIDKKRCASEWEISMNPTSYAQLLIDKIPKHNKDLTVEALNDTIKSIDNGVFPRNLEKCHNIKGIDHLESMYGKDCPYASKCWKTKENK